MKTKVFFKSVVLATVLLASSLAVSARSYDSNLIYNSEEKDGVMIGQTVYKMDSGTLANYMKYSYKYDDNRRMTESETQKWNNRTNKWENDLRINYIYAGKTITTNYYKWNNKSNSYVIAPEMTVTMDSTGI